MNKCKYEILGVPIALKRHRHSGKNCYDSQKKEKISQQWGIKNFLTSAISPACGSIKLMIEYHMPIPKSFSKKKAKECLFRPHCKQPDLSNLIKFTEDTFNKIIWEDDSFISEIEAKKFYSKIPKTIFKIEYIDSHLFEEMK